MVSSGSPGPKRYGHARREVYNGGTAWGRTRMDMDKKLLIVQAAALGWDFLRNNGVRACEGLEFKPADRCCPP